MEVSLHSFDMLIHINQLQLGDTALQMLLLLTEKLRQFVANSQFGILPSSLI
jgi:hypothetical protein